MGMNFHEFWQQAVSEHDFPRYASVIVFGAPAQPKAVLVIDPAELSITITSTISLSTSTFLRFPWVAIGEKCLNLK
jgi:hypothetical protein